MFLSRCCVCFVFLCLGGDVCFVSGLCLFCVGWVCVALATGPARVWAPGPVGVRVQLLVLALVIFRAFCGAFLELFWSFFDVFIRKCVF